MISLNAYFDGKVFIPDEPLTLSANQRVRIEVELMPHSASQPPKPKRQLGQQRDLVAYLSPDWEAPLPDDMWRHNTDEEARP